MFETLRSLATTVVTLLQSRTELAGLELAQAQGRFLRWILGGLVALLFLFAALLLLSFIFIAALWDDIGWRAALWPLALYVVIGVAIGWRIRSEVAQAPSPLARTSAELARDRDLIVGSLRRASDSDGRADGLR